MNRKQMLGDHLADEDFEKISELGAGNGGNYNIESLFGKFPRFVDVFER